MSPVHLEASQAWPRQFVKVVLRERWMTIFRPQRRAFRVRWVTFLLHGLRQAARSVQLGNMHPTQAVLNVPSVRQGSMWTRRATMLKQIASAARAERMWT